MWWMAIGCLAMAGPRADERRAEKADPFSQRNLDRALKVVVPLVEEAAGRSFLTDPVLELSSEEVFGRMLEEEQRLIMDAVLSATPPEVRERMAERSAGGMPAGVMGKYGIFEDKLFLCPEAITYAAKHSALPTHRLEEFVHLILAHELSHALHDQHVDLADLTRGISDLDALHAARGTWEGLATWIEAQVAEELELSEAHALLIELQGWSEDGLEEPLAYPIWAIYGQGRDAIAWHHEQGGVDRVWEVAAQPPQRSSGLFRPETWPAAAAQSPIDYTAILRGVEQVVTRGDWLVGITTLGEYSLRGEAIMGHTEAELESVLVHLTHAWSLQGSRPGRSTEVRILQFDDPQWPGAYLDLLRTQQTEAARDQASGIGRPIEVTHEAFDQVEGDDAVRRVARIQGVGGTGHERQTTWVVRGSTVVVVTTEGFRPGMRAGWAITSLFDRLEAARAGSELPPHGGP